MSKGIIKQQFKPVAADCKSEDLITLQEELD